MWVYFINLVKSLKIRKWVLKSDSKNWRLEYAISDV